MASGAGPMDEASRALSLFSQGSTRAAIEPLQRALALDPGLTAGWRLLGDILMVSDRFIEARSAYDRQLLSMIRDPRLRLAASALADNRLDEAERDLRAFLARNPASLAAAHLMSEVLRRRGRPDGAEKLLVHCLEKAPDFHLARQSLALALVSQRRPAEALVELDYLLARDPRDHRSTMMKAAALTELGDHEAAAEVMAGLLRVFPDQPHPWLLYGNGLRTLGRTAEAVAAFNCCIGFDPGCGDAWWGLANLKTYRFPAEARAAMAAQLARSDLDAQDRSKLHFSLGKAWEDEGRFADAFAQYERANAIQRGLRGYDAGRTSDFVRRSKALFTPSFFAERTGSGASDPAPIFIVGLPRSGSTLVEQILASHPLVEAVGELGDIQTIADWIGSQEGGGYPQALTALRGEDLAVLGGQYLDWNKGRRRQGRARFIDKAPWNFQHIGLIQLILPAAKIVDVRRHPLGCGWSAFKQHFEHGSDFSYDLADIGRYYADYVDLMAHMDQVLPGRVHRLVYERLVADTEGEVRRLLDYLGMPFDAACLRFFENRRAVATPSSEQVRQPIFTEAVDQWRNFEPWLGPLKAALG